MTIPELKMLMETGKFHHATYRNQGTLWEGLHIYVRSEDIGSFRGFKHAGIFLKDQPDMEQAENLVRHTGVSLGAYGHG